MNGKKEQQKILPPPRLLLDGLLQIRAVNRCLRRLCDLDAEALHGLPVEEWINAETALLARIRTAIARGSSSWIELLELQLPDFGLVVARLRLVPLRGRRRNGLLVTIEQIHAAGSRENLLAA